MHAVSFCDTQAIMIDTGELYFRFEVLSRAQISLTKLTGLTYTL